MKKIVFTDIDGTLLDGIRGFPYVSKRNLYALKELLSNDIAVIISSGRSHSIINKEILDVRPSGFILCNGSYIEVNNEVVYKNILNKDVVDHIVDCTNRCRGLCIYETQDGVYATEDNKEAISLFKKQWNMPALDIMIQKPDNQEIYKMLPAFLNEKDCENFERMLGKKYEVKRQKAVYAYDVTAKNINKGEAVKIVLDKLNISKEDAIAFGDNVNDLDMLKEVKTGICVGNGDPRLKEVADEVCEDCLDDGFYKWLVKNNIINEMRF